MTCTRRRLCLQFGLMLLGGLAFAGKVSAAPPGGFDASSTAPANEVTEFRGTLKGVRGPIMTVTREDGTEVLVQIPDTAPQLVFVARALPPYLRRGMMVRYDTMLGPQGTPMAPVSKVELFAPIDLRGVPGHNSTDWQPGIHSADRSAPKGQPITGKATVVGTLMMVTPQGGLAVAAGRTPVQAMLSPDATFELRINNLSLAQPGDPITVAGFYQPPDDTKVKGDRVVISVERVYGETPEPPARRTRMTRQEQAAEAAMKAQTEAAAVAE